MRLLGISLASFSSGKLIGTSQDFPLFVALGLGELTFLQLSTTYAPPSVGGRSVGYVIDHTLCARTYSDDSGILRLGQALRDWLVPFSGGSYGNSASELALVCLRYVVSGTHYLKYLTLAPLAIGHAFDYSPHLFFLLTA